MRSILCRSNQVTEPKRDAEGVATGVTQVSAPWDVTHTSNASSFVHTLRQSHRTEGDAHSKGDVKTTLEHRARNVSPYQTRHISTTSRSYNFPKSNDQIMFN